MARLTSYQPRALEDMMFTDCVVCNGVTSCRMTIPENGGGRPYQTLHDTTRTTATKMPIFMLGTQDSNSQPSACEVGAVLYPIKLFRCLELHQALVNSVIFFHFKMSKLVCCQQLNLSKMLYRSMYSITQTNKTPALCFCFCYSFFGKFT